MNEIQTSIIAKDGQVTIKATQDFTPIMEQAVALHNEGHHGSSEMKHAARLPKLAVELYCQNNGIDFHEFCSNEVHVKRMCNDPELSKFRIWPGKL